MEENSALRTLIDTGKGDLQWERDIPPASLSNLEGLAKGDFQANLGKIVHDIWAFPISNDGAFSPAPGPEGRGGGPDREEGHHPGPLRDPGQVHLEACLGRLPHAETSATPKLEVVAVTC